MKKLRGSIFVEAIKGFNHNHEEKISGIVNNLLDAQGHILVSQLDFTNHIDEEPGDNLLEINFLMKTDKDFEAERFAFDELLSEYLSDENYNFYDTKYELA